MSYDTRQDYEGQPRYSGQPHDEPRDELRPDYEEPDLQQPAEQPRDEASPRSEPPAWHDADHDAEPVAEPAAAGPSDLDAVEPEPSSPKADADTPVDTGAPPVAVGTAPVEPAHEAVTLWPEDAKHDFQQRWREVQLAFVDDPRAAAGEAQELVSEVLDQFSTTLAARKSELDGWQGTDGSDTEQMRTVVRRYRKLLDRLLEV
jgi:hypothetical protein